MKYIQVIIILLYSSVIYSQGYVLKRIDGTTDLPDSAITVGKISGLKQWAAANIKTINGNTLFAAGDLSITASTLGLGNVTNESKATMFTSPAFTGTPTGITATHVGLGSVNNTTDAEKPISTLTQTALNSKQATLVSGSNIKTVNGATLLGSTDIPTTRKVAQADIAATASATSTTTLFTPSASGFYRVAIYMKISTTGTSPVAGPVTITYTEPDGSVAQSHVMLLQSVTGTVVTTTVNNSTTTGTVNGSMVIYAKTGVAIQYAIAVSGTFGAGRYIAHISCEQL